MKCGGRELGTDERGAVAFVALFMAMLLTGAACYLMGIGDTLLQRQRLQDAADAVAFSSAVLHARGMNLLALINMIMAALLAILVALKLVELLTTIALIAIAIASYFAPGLASAIPSLAQLRANVQSAHDELRDPIHQALEAMHVAGSALRAAVPTAATAAVFASVQQDYAPQVTGGLAVPPRLTLPTEDGRFAQLCDKSGEYVGELTSSALGELVPAPIADTIAAAQAGLVSAGTTWFCGEGGSPPSHRQTQTARYPQLPSRKRCADYDTAAADYDPLRHQALCAEAERAEAESQPDPNSGGCGEGCRREVYEQRAALARTACAPRRQGDRLENFEWQERRMQRTYVFESGRWRLVAEREFAPPRLERANRRPCGERGAKVSTTWNEPLRDGSGAALPLCSDATPPHDRGHAGDRVALVHTEISQIFGCTEQYEQTFELEKQDRNDRVSDGDAPGESDKVPQLLEQGVELGEEDFQIRAAVFGAAPDRRAERMLEIASWGRSPAPLSGVLAVAAPLGRCALAQAEYFYAVQGSDPAERASFLWNMRWQARLRRFRLSDAAGGFAQQFVPVCSAALNAFGKGGESACQTLVTAFAELAH